MAAEMDADSLHLVSEVGRSQILAIADEPSDISPCDQPKILCQ